MILLGLSCNRLLKNHVTISVLCPILVVPWVGLHCVIAILTGQTHFCNHYVLFSKTICLFRVEKLYGHLLDKGINYITGKL